MVNIASTFFHIALISLSILATVMSLLATWCIVDYWMHCKKLERSKSASSTSFTRGNP